MFTVLVTQVTITSGQADQLVQRAVFFPWNDCVKTLVWNLEISGQAWSSGVVILTGHLDLTDQLVKQAFWVPEHFSEFIFLRQVHFLFGHLQISGQAWSFQPVIWTSGNRSTLTKFANFWEFRATSKVGTIPHQSGPEIRAEQFAYVHSLAEIFA